MPNYTPDPWYISKRLYAAIVLILCTILASIGVEVDQDTQVLIVDNLVAVGTGVSMLIASGLAIWSKYNERDK